LCQLAVFSENSNAFSLPKLQFVGTIELLSEF